MKKKFTKNFVSKYSAYGSLMLLMSLLHLAVTPIHAEPYQCDISGDGRLGLEEAIYILRDYSGAFVGGSSEVLDCGEPDFEITESGNLSTDAKRYILCRVNEIRSQVALGTIEDDGENTYWPVATNMKRMQWDNDLATVAQNYASQCVYGHNPDAGSVGENIAISWWGGPLGPNFALGALEGAFSGWNGENDDWHYDTINDTSWDTGFGHFTQHVWADTTMVGCGQAWCPAGTWSCADGCEETSSSNNMVFTVCNFYIAGNWTDYFPYSSGSEVCTEDFQAGDICENGLITPANYHDGLGFECDVNGDNALGLEELIEALKILSDQLI